MPTGSQPSTSTTENQLNITIVNRQLNVKPFHATRDLTDTASWWDKWKKDIERQFRFFGITDPDLKKDGLIIYGGQDIADLEDSLPDPPTQEDDDAYQQLTQKLDRHFLSRKNKDYARFQTDEPLAN